MSQRNGDRSRYNRRRKKKILQRKNNRALARKVAPLRADLSY